MADISKIKTPDGTEYNIKDTTARSDLSGKQATITASGVLIGDGSGGVTAKTLDTSSLTNDNDHIPTSGVVKSAITEVETDLASIHATGTTNATGAKIPKWKYFYLNGALVQAIADIANGSTFTLNTNYMPVTAGALNELPKFVGATVTDLVELDPGVVTQYTIPEDGYYFIWAITTNTAAICAAFIGASNTMTPYIQACVAGNGSYLRATTGVVPFKKGTVIYARAQTASKANGGSAALSMLT